jgi:acetoin utilization deacetylase AcuC-like enzyme
MPLLYTHPLALEHDTGPGHPERADRLRAIERAISAAPLPGLVRREPGQATRAQLERVHDPAYVARLLALRGKCAQLDPETFVSPQTIDAALYAAGGAVAAVDAVLGGEDKAAFVLARPPGHHAERDVAMGFCFFNNVAIAACHAVEVYGLERVLALDWDVHHGNGTQRTFWERADVLTIDLHQNGLWPEQSGLLGEVGQGAGEGMMMNVPLVAGQGDEAYLAAFERVIEPVVDAYAPQLILVSAGFDAHVRDPLAQMAVSSAGYAAMAERVMALAQRHAEGRAVFVLEGGYDLEGVSQGTRACLDVLCGQRGRWESRAAAARVANVEAIRAHHARWWPTLAVEATSQG